jgi:transcriptional regulator with PAS, ATPase and Fis domain
MSQNEHKIQYGNNKDSAKREDADSDVVSFVTIDEHSSDGQKVICRDSKTERLLSMADSVAKTPSTVLLSGESGVGKEVIARYVHRNSDRSDGPFVGINCAALPPSLLESELFGHEEGAFSGAIEQHIGVFERAQGGTLLLDEISETPLELQAKLLRVLQEKKLTRVGGTETIDLDFRLIATTNRDLKEEVDEGNFRRDLFYRLNVFPIEIPALRDRPADIEPLARYYLARFADRFEKQLHGIKEEALECLRNYPFPGNVRELINVLERATIISGDSPHIEKEHLVLDSSIEMLSDHRSDDENGGNPEMGGPEPKEHVVSFKAGEEPLTDIRRKIILNSLVRFDGNRTKTAEALGVSVRTIRNRINQYREDGVPIPE